MNNWGREKRPPWEWHAEQEKNTAQEARSWASYVEALTLRTSDVTALGDGAFKVVIKVK